jgi:hypothetical protein
MSTRRQLLCEIFGLCGLAITQPLLAVFGRVPNQFAVRGATAGDVVRFALLIAFFPTILLFTVEVAAGIVGVRWRDWVHRAVVVFLVAVLVRQVIGDDRGPLAAFMISGLIGVMVAIARERWAAIRLWLRYTAVAPFLFVAFFLFATPTGELLRGNAQFADAEAATPAPIVLIVLDELPLTGFATPPRYLRSPGTRFRRSSRVKPRGDPTVPPSLTIHRTSLPSWGAATSSTCTSRSLGCAPQTPAAPSA